MPRLSDLYRAGPFTDDNNPKWPLQAPFILLAASVALLGLALLTTLISGYHGGFVPLNSFGSHFPDSFWASLTLLGDTRVAIALLLFFVYRNPQLLPATLIATIPATIVVHGYKQGLAMPRPAAVLDPDQIHIIDHILRSGSFPSGHSTTIGVIAALLVLLSNRRALQGGLLAVMLLVGVSRVMVGAHWPVDVLTGCGIGLLSGLFGYWVTCRYRLGRSPWSRWLLLILPLYAALSVYAYDGGYPHGHLVAMLLATAALLRFGVQLFHHLNPVLAQHRPR